MNTLCTKNRNEGTTEKPDSVRLDWLLNWTLYLFCLASFIQWTSIYFLFPPYFWLLIVLFFRFLDRGF